MTKGNISEPVFYGLNTTNVVSLARDIYSFHDIQVGLIAKADCRFCAFTCAQWASTMSDVALCYR